MKQQFVTALMIAILHSPLIAVAGVDPNDAESARVIVVQASAESSSHADTAELASPITVEAHAGDEKYSTLQFYASDKAAEIQYETNKSMLGLGNDRSRIAFLFNEERDNAITASFMFDANLQSINGLAFSFGPKLTAGLLGFENNDVISLGASAEMVYTLPSKRVPLRLSGEISYSPDILTFGQSDRVIDFNYRAGLPLTSNIHGFVGLRYLQFDTRPGERKLDQHVHVGFRWSN